MANYTTYWVPTEGADMAALLAQHQRVFPRNTLAVISGYAKVAVLDSEVPPAGALDSATFTPPSPPMPSGLI